MEFLALPFMQRAFLAGTLAALTSGFLGIFVVLRKSSFFGDAIAHASLAGIAMGIILGINPLFTAGILAVFIALFLFQMEKENILSIDTLLGFILPFFMAMGVLILTLAPSYQSELISFLFGSILSVSKGSLLAISGLSIVVLLFIYFLRNDLILTTFDKNQARISGVSVDKILLFYYLLLALTIIISIKTVGIILANALLVIPAATAKLLANSLSEMFILTPLLAMLGTIVGLILSYFFNFPSGPSIVVSIGLQFLFIFSIKRLI